MQLCEKSCNIHLDSEYYTVCGRGKCVSEQNVFGWILTVRSEFGVMWEYDFLLLLSIINPCSLAVRAVGAGRGGTMGRRVTRRSARAVEKPPGIVWPKGTCRVMVVFPHTMSVRIYSKFTMFRGLLLQLFSVPIKLYDIILPASLSMVIRL